ncbi:hypothetical protein [Metarhizobium album]|uniref:hypothetical protein n=1 Tax=Metarhizobium album TaxID=2182425 RepID=UPI000FFF5B31|nr:hypothetical protein [Rhizobium album]
MTEARKIGRTIGNLIAEHAVRSLTPVNVVKSELGYLIAAAEVDLSKMQMPQPIYDLAVGHIRDAAVTEILRVVEGIDPAAFAKGTNDEQSV